MLRYPDSPLFCHWTARLTPSKFCTRGVVSLHREISTNTTCCCLSDSVDGAIYPDWRIARRDACEGRSGACEIVAFATATQLLMERAVLRYALSVAWSYNDIFA